MMKKEENEFKNNGHRKRLRGRFLQNGLEGFLDYEIIELLLTLGTPRKDCKQMAKDAIKKFGGLRAVLDASFTGLQQIKGIGPSNAFGVKLFQAISERYAREQISEKITLDSPKLVANYLQKYIGREKKEHFVVVLLDVKNNLIDIENISVGILNSSLVHPREVFNSAIKKHAASVIVAHNHPFGDLTPSDEDKKITENLIKSGKLLGINIIDHIIFSSVDYYSFQNNMSELFL